MFLGFIAGMDTYARSLKTAYTLRQSGEIEEFIRKKYRSWKIIEFFKELTEVSPFGFFQNTAY